MCYEDVKEGLRRWSRVTTDPASGSTIPANKNRVALRLLAPLNLAADFQARLSMPGTADLGIVLFVNNGNPVDEIWLERHGTLVQEAFAVFHNFHCSVVEILNSELDKPPAAGNPYDSVSRAK